MVVKIIQFENILLQVVIVPKNSFARWSLFPNCNDWEDEGEQNEATPLSDDSSAEKQRRLLELGITFLCSAKIVASKISSLLNYNF